MKIKPGFVLRNVAGQGVVIATGEASKSFHGMVKLNTTGTAIWQGVEAGLTADQIAAKLALDFDVSTEKALEDVLGMIEKMKDAGFIVE